MRRAASSRHTEIMALVQLCSGKALLEQPVAAGTRRAARSVTVAAAGRPQQRPGNGPRQQQDVSHQHDFDTIRREWHVRRTELRHFPEEVQERIRGGSPGGTSGTSGGRAASGVQRSAAHTSSGRPAQPQGSSTGDGADSDVSPAADTGSGRAGQAALAADLQKLLAALEYERRTGFGNVVGSIERVPVADWAGRQLLNAAGQLQAQPSAAHACVAAAQRLRRYAGAGAAERQAAVAAAEAAAQAALQVAQVGARTLAGRQGRYAPPQAASAAPAAPGAQLQPPPPLHRAPPQGPQAQQQWRQQQPVQLQQPADAAGTAAPSAATHVAGAAWASSAVPAQGPAAAATGAGGSVTAAVTEAAGPAAVAAGPAAPDLDLDAAAEEAHAEESGQQRHTPEGEEYVMQGNRRVKASTVAFRRSFAEAAAAAEAAAEATAARGGQAPLAALLAAGGEQRTADWLRLRERRLTASAFSKAIGLFSDDRQQLWGEKVGMVEPFAGNAATAWGTSAEPKALDEYRAVTGQRIASCMFQVRHDDPIHGWLGASPDGLIESLSLDATAPAGAAGAAGGDDLSGGSDAGSTGAGAAGWQHAAPVRGAGPLAGPGRGILEIKCPYNRGQPELAVPPPHAIWYYMPQVQGLMYIFDCEWCNLYIWTPKRGSAVYHIRRDRRYWAQLWGVLAEFWWNHVVPARQEFQAGRWEEVEQYRPSARIEATELLREWSKRMALEAPATFFGPQPQSSGIPRQ